MPLTLEDCKAAANLYLDMPECEHGGCQKAGIFYVIQDKKSFCEIHVSEHVG